MEKNVSEYVCLPDVYWRTNLRYITLSPDNHIEKLMRILQPLFFAFLLVFFVSPAAGQLPEHWSKPVEPYQVIDNIYYVGAIGISAHIIVSSEGLILLDTGTELMLPGLRENIQKLGHNLEDVNIILSSHAHWDHVEGHAAMKELTGARIMAVGEDATAISSGVDNSALGAQGWTPAEVDRVLKDGDTVTLGDVTMTAHLTPGHTKGCTTWTMTVTENNTEYQVVFIGGTSVNPGVNLIENERHPGIADDYARTFKVLKSLKGEVFLGQHPMMYDMLSKMDRLITQGKRRVRLLTLKGIGHSFWPRKKPIQPRPEYYAN